MRMFNVELCRNMNTASFPESIVILIRMWKPEVRSFSTSAASAIDWKLQCTNPPEIIMHGVGDTNSHFAQACWIWIDLGFCLCLERMDRWPNIGSSCASNMSWGLQRWRPLIQNEFTCAHIHAHKLGHKKLQSATCCSQCHWCTRCWQKTINTGNSLGNNYAIYIYTYNILWYFMANICCYQVSLYVLGSF